MAMVSGDATRHISLYSAWTLHSVWSYPLMLLEGERKPPLIGIDPIDPLVCRHPKSDP